VGSNGIVGVGIRGHSEFFRGGGNFWDQREGGGGGKTPRGRGNPRAPTGNKQTKTKNSAKNKRFDLITKKKKPKRAAKCPLSKLAGGGIS